MILEVLPEGTEAYDRGEKFGHYRSIPSLVEYVLVSSRGEPCVERFERRAAEWGLSSAGPGESLELRLVGVTLDVNQLYANLVDAHGNVAVA